MATALVLAPLVGACAPAVPVASPFPTVAVASPSAPPTAASFAAALPTAASFAAAPPTAASPAAAPSASAPAGQGSDTGGASPGPAGSTPPASPSLPAPAESPTASPTASTLAALVAALPVAAEHRTGYERTLFRLWIDFDHNGCDTRKEVLLAEAVVAPAVGAHCSLTGGAWVSPYDGLRFTSAGKLDIDHVVPLAEAWDSGAWTWTPKRREAYANDLAVPYALIAVSASSNRAKGDQDPAQWLPPLAAFDCTYVVDWVAVKTRWGLSVDPAEHTALATLAAGCTTTPVPPIPAPWRGPG